MNDYIKDFVQKLAIASGIILIFYRSLEWYVEFGTCIVGLILLFCGLDWRYKLREDK